MQDKKKEIVSIGEVIEEYMNSIDRGVSKDIFLSWERIAGPELYSCCDIYEFSDGKIVIGYYTSAAYSLLVLNKRRILSEYKKSFPGAGIKEIRFKRMS